MAKEEIFKDKPPERKDLFQCKACNQWSDKNHLHVITVMQRNNPLEWPHVKFNSKADVSICGKCFQNFSR